LSRLERICDEAGVEAVHAFFERMLEHRDDPEVSAAEDLRRLMKEAEAALRPQDHGKRVAGRPLDGEPGPDRGQ
jgi:hypothetical protein